MLKKIIDYKDLKRSVSKLNGDKILIGGCFDIIHLGHIRFLKEAKRQGDKLIIILESDEFIKIKKKRKPIHSQKERAEILSSFEMVDLIVKIPFFKSYEKYLELVEMVNPKIIAVTKDDPQIKNKTKQAKKIGGKVSIVINRIRNLSSEKITKQLF